MSLLCFEAVNQSQVEFVLACTSLLSVFDCREAWAYFNPFEEPPPSSDSPSDPDAPPSPVEAAFAPLFRIVREIPETLAAVAVRQPQPQPDMLRLHRVLLDTLLLGVGKKPELISNYFIRQMMSFQDSFASIYYITKTLPNLKKKKKNITEQSVEIRSVDWVKNESSGIRINCITPDITMDIGAERYE